MNSGHFLLLCVYKEQKPPGDLLWGKVGAVISLDFPLLFLGPYSLLAEGHGRTLGKGEDPDPQPWPH